MFMDLPKVRNCTLEQLALNTVWVFQIYGLIELKFTAQHVDITA